MEKCYFCESVCEKLPSRGASNIYGCNNCGKYCISFTYSGEFHDKLNNTYKDKKHLIAGWLYEFNREKEEPYMFITGELEKLLNEGRMPKTPIQRLERFLLNLYKTSNKIGETYWVSTDNKIGMGNVTQNLISPCAYPISIAYAHNIGEIKYMFESLESLGYLKHKEKQGFTIMPKGLEKAEQLLNSNIDSKSVFVAMWFTKELDLIYDNVIKSAINECGFNEFRVDRKEHNNDITDEIIAGIKQSLFMIADLTGHRGGVYHEAGYARGLKREVILTCRKDWFDGDPREYKKVHFDLNHFPIIVWEEDKLDDFKKAIINRIRATIL